VGVAVRFVCPYILAKNMLLNYNGRTACGDTPHHGVRGKKISIQAWEKECCMVGDVDAPGGYREWS